MIEIRETEEYARWHSRLRDREAQTRINIRIDRLARGNPGDFRSVGSGVAELRINYGPGYRVYYTRRGDELMILLAGGDKSSQQNDIRLAIQLAREN